jgi:hypothetical protein
MPMARGRTHAALALTLLVLGGCLSQPDQKPSPASPALLSPTHGGDGTRFRLDLSSFTDDTSALLLKIDAPQGGNVVLSVDANWGVSARGKCLAARIGEKGPGGQMHTATRGVVSSSTLSKEIDQPIKTSETLGTFPFGDPLPPGGSELVIVGHNDPSGWRASGASVNFTLESDRPILVSIVARGWVKCATSSEEFDSGEYNQIAGTTITEAKDLRSALSPANWSLWVVASTDGLLDLDVSNGGRVVWEHHRDAPAPQPDFVNCQLRLGPAPVVHAGRLLGSDKAWIMTMGVGFPEEAAFLVSDLPQPPRCS